MYVEKDFWDKKIRDLLRLRILLRSAYELNFKLSKEKEYINSPYDISLSSFVKEASLNLIS